MSGAISSRGVTPGPPTADSAYEGRRFLIQQCLGRGGFGEVYRATMTSAGGVRTEVAIKVLRSDLDPGSDSVRRLRDEGHLLGALSHPAILRVHDLVLLEGRVALVTEYVEGEDLDTCLAADPRIPLRALMGALGEVASALDVAWNAPSPQGGPVHLVHRDVKPANIRLGRHGEVKLLDFGIARATNLDREAQTANNAMLGSYLYMAPERYHDEGVAPPSDMYALGCILFEGLTGNRLFDGLTLKQIYGTMLLSRKLRAHLDERVKLVPDDTPEGVRELMLSLLEPDPDARPTAKEVSRKAEDLTESLSGPTLKRWARSREWPPQPHIVGSLDGRELVASSFDVRNTPAPAREPAPD
ncbi:MAG: serine/threonine-protein kinase, partial [Myxococcota bacterium]